MGAIILLRTIGTAEAATITGSIAIFHGWYRPAASLRRDGEVDCAAR